MNKKQICTKDKPEPNSKETEHPHFIVIEPPKEDWEYGEVWEKRQCIYCNRTFDYKIQ